MNRLWIKLSGAFALVIVVGVIVTILLTRQGTATQISHAMVGHRMIQPSQLQVELGNYYRTQGSWAGLDRALDELFLASGTGMGRMMGSMMGTRGSHLRVLDMNGQVVADSQSLAGEPQMHDEVTTSLPIVVGNQQVGTLILGGSIMANVFPTDNSVVSDVTRAVSVAALIAAMVAFLLGGLLIHQITRPLAQLTIASRRIAEGDLAARVSIKSRDELGQLSHTFNHMASALETQEQLRRQLVADIAHELRTPLTGIQGTIEALQDGIFELELENLAPVHSQVTLLNQLVDDLRTLSLTDTGALVIDSALINITELVEASLSALHSQTRSKEIEFVVVAEPSLPPIMGDRHRLAQVFNNLVSNAFRHTPPKGTIRVELSIKDNAQVNKIGINQDESQMMQVAIIDNGPGIAEEELPFIFDRFYRADRSRSRATGGTGLGLAIARQLIEAHAGILWVESPPPGEQVGSGFYFLLPVADSAAAATG